MSGFQNALTALSSLGYAGNSAPVQIGSLTLAGVEVPSILRVGGEQNLVVTTLPGGARVVQAMGDDPAKLTLAGMFIGPGAKARALLLEKMRIAAAPVKLGIATLAMQVVISAYAYVIESKGAICRYELSVEVLPSAASAAGSATASLTALVGSDIGSAINTIAQTVGDVSAYATTAIAQGQTVIGQAMPIATLVGLGGPLSKVSDALSTANIVAQSGTDFASIPSSAAVLISGLQSAGASLMDTINTASNSLSGINAAANPGDIAAGPAALVAAAGNAEVLSTAVQAGALVNRAAANAALATSAPNLPVPLVHA